MIARIDAEATMAKKVSVDNSAVLAASAPKREFP
jgi:hypothetical protein